MRIGVVSDSHGNSRTLKQAIDAMGPVAVIFHLGDYVSDGESIKKMVDIPVITLRGNMDIGY
ncbi:MAG: metallophosphoesterase family protein, partial [Eubacterium sp.]